MREIGQSIGFNMRTVTEELNVSVRAELPVIGR